MLYCVTVTKSTDCGVNMFLCCMQSWNASFHKAPKILRSWWRPAKTLVSGYVFTWPASREAVSRISRTFLVLKKYALYTVHCIVYVWIHPCIHIYCISANNFKLFLYISHPKGRGIIWKTKWSSLHIKVHICLITQLLISMHTRCILAPYYSLQSTA